MAALKPTLNDDHNRLQLVDPACSGWGGSCDGVRVITAINKVIRASLTAESFLQYLATQRKWPASTLALFSKERWASKLVMLRQAANATVIIKMIRGWLASQSGMITRGQVSLDTLTVDQILDIGICRLCRTAPETN